MTEKGYVEVRKMAAFIFSLLFLIAGITVGTLMVFSSKKITRTDKGEVVVYPLRKFAAIPYAVGAVLFTILIIVACTTTVNTGHTGVVTKFGQVQDYTLDSGLHGKSPWITVIEMDNRVQKRTVDMECFSSDIQEVKCK